MNLDFHAQGYTTGRGKRSNLICTIFQKLVKGISSSYAERKSILLRCASYNINVAIPKIRVAICDRRSNHVLKLVLKEDPVEARNKSRNENNRLGFIESVHVQ